MVPPPRGRRYSTLADGGIDGGILSFTASIRASPYTVLPSPSRLFGTFRWYLLDSFQSFHKCFELFHKICGITPLDNLPKTHGTQDFCNVYSNFDACDNSECTSTIQSASTF